MKISGLIAGMDVALDGPVGVVDITDDEAERLIRAHSLNQMALSIRKAVIDANDTAPYGLIKGGTIVGIALTSKATHEGDIVEVES